MTRIKAVIFAALTVLSTGAPANSLAQSLVETGRITIPCALPTHRRASQETPIWTGGAFVVVEENESYSPTIRSFDDSGHETAPIHFSIPGAQVVRVRSVARGNDGAYAVSGQAFDPEGRMSGFVSWVAPGLTVVNTIRTFPYIANILAVAPDGTVWTEGLEADQYGDDRNRRVADWSHGVIRHFDTSGRQIGAYMPRQRLSGNRTGLVDGFLAASDGLVCWYTNHTHSYFELNPANGKVTSYPGVAQPNDASVSVMALALLDSGDVFAGTVTSGEAGKRVFRLDRAGRTWKQVDLPFAPHGSWSGLLAGGDGRRLAFYGTAPAELRFLALKN